MRLTSREKEIFEVLKKEPLISQEELAHRFGITRSSIAVHISNLMKKGVILGKGYVFNEQISIVVIGESCYYIEANGPDNDCSINMSLGGFAVVTGRIFANFGLNVKLIRNSGETEIFKIINTGALDVSGFLDAFSRHCFSTCSQTKRSVLINNEWSNNSIANLIDDSSPN